MLGIALRSVGVWPVFLGGLVLFGRAAASWWRRRARAARRAEALGGEQALGADGAGGLGEVSGDRSGTLGGRCLSQRHGWSGWGSQRLCAQRAKRSVAPATALAAVEDRRAGHAHRSLLARRSLQRSFQDCFQGRHPARPGVGRKLKNEGHCPVAQPGQGLLAARRGTTGK